MNGNISACQVTEEIEILCKNIKIKKTQNFLTSNNNSLLVKLERKNMYIKKKKNNLWNKLTCFITHFCCTLKSEQVLLKNEKYFIEPNE